MQGLFLSLFSPVFHLEGEILSSHKKREQHFNGWHMKVTHVWTLYETCHVRYPNVGPVPFTSSRFFVCQTLIFLHFLSSVCSLRFLHLFTY